MKPEQIKALELMKEYLANTSNDVKAEIHRQVDEMMAEVEDPSNEDEDISSSEE